MRVRSMLVGALGLGFAVSSPAVAQRYDAASEAEARALAVRATEYLGQTHGPAGLATWQDATDGRTPALRHAKSGAVCRLWASYGSVYAEPDPYFDRVDLGDAVTCTTYSNYRSDNTTNWELSTRIERADLALRGRRYHGFDGERNSGMGWVEPAYVARRAAWWSTGRSGPVQRLASLAMTDGSGRGVEVSRYRTRSYEDWEELTLSTLVDGWLVLVELRSARGQQEGAERVAQDHMAVLVSTIVQQAPGATAVAEGLTVSRAQAEQVRDAEDAAINEAQRAEARAIVDAFERACLATADAGRGFEPWLTASGWRAVEARDGLPRVAPDRPLRAWRAPGEADVYVHLGAIVGGDCAVSAYGVDGARLRPYLIRALTEGEAPWMSPGWVSEMSLEPIELYGLDGDRWPGGGVLIVNGGVEGRPSLTLGIAPP
jgi:hypothetical protein